MAKSILWLENEKSYETPYIRKLQSRGFDLEVVETVTEAQRALERKRYDLLILDVMVPTRSREEEESFPPGDTDLGTKTGLYFYQRMKSKLDESGTKVLVYTVRMDRETMAGFRDSGLPADCYETKLSLRHVLDFERKICEMLGVTAE